MTPETLIRNHLCLRIWALRIVLPSMLVLMGLLYIFSLASDGSPSEVARFRDHAAAIVGFFAFYFVLVRGGHMVMIRSLHKDLMKKHEAAYRYELSAVDPILFRKRTMGFTLAQIKRRIIDDANRPPSEPSRY